MKKLNLILTGLLLILLSSIIAAQTKTGFEYFKGKWTIVAGGPTGDVVMIVGIEKINDKVTGTISDSDGKEMFKVVNTAITDKQAVIRFNGSQGEVAMTLTIKDEDHLNGDIMDGMVSVTGVRIKNSK
jgi:hypothetical protein